MRNRSHMVLALFFVSTLAGQGPMRPAAAAPPQEVLSGIARYEQWFAERPELVGKSGTGWKPMIRARWLLDGRRSYTDRSPGVLRQEAFEEARSRAAAHPGLSSSDWFLIGPHDLSGRANCIDFEPGNPSVVYVGTGGGLWKSSNGGDSWAPCTDGLAVNELGAVRVLPWAPSVVLIGTGLGNGATVVYGTGGAGGGPFGVGILKSVDGGVTWGTTSLSYPLTGAAGFSAIEVNPLTHTILAAANDGLYRSTDDGDTWTQVETGGNWWDVQWRPGDSLRVYASKGSDPFFNSITDAGVKVSNDDGLTFAHAGTGQPTGNLASKIKLAVSAASPDLVYAHYGRIGGAQGTLGIYRSSDAGATWQARATSINMAGNQSWYNQVIETDPDDPDVLITGGIRLYRSTNGGTTYAFTPPTGTYNAFGTEVSPHADAHDLEYEPGSTDALWVATDAGVWRSPDDGVTWASRREGIITYQFYDICVAQSDPLFLIGGSQDNGFPRRIGVDTWLKGVGIGDGMACFIDPVNANLVYATAQNGDLRRSTNGGASWVSMNSGLSGTGIWVNPLVGDPSNGQHLYTRRSTGIYRSTNGGLSWVLVGSQSARSIAINRADGDVVWTMSNFAGVWVSTDDGGTWTQSTTFPATGSEKQIHAHATDAGTAFVVSGGYAGGISHILRTTDFGATWSDHTGDLPDQPVNVLIVDPALTSHWYIGTDTGVWTSHDEGTTWLPFGAGLANGVITDLEIRESDHKLVASTFGRGAWEIELPSAAVDVTLPPRRANGLMLDAPYPNPARGSVLLRYATRATGPARLEVFDEAGRRVSVVTRAIPGDGVIRVAEWNPGRRIPPGVYFAVLSAGRDQRSRKIVVIE